MAPRGLHGVVNVSSSAHRISPLRFGDYNFEGKPLPQNEKPRAGFPAWVHETTDGFPAPWHMP